jgi:acetyl/propionyl-CoA carboxylase alpha subunit
MAKLAVTIEGRTFEVEIDLQARPGAEISVLVDGEPVRVMLPEAGTPSAGVEWIVVDDRPYEIDFDRSERCIRDFRGAYPVELRDLEVLVARPPRGNGVVKAPIPGVVTQVLVSEGQAVELGQPLLVLEAMKMANEIRAPHAGVIGRVRVAPHQTVAREDALVELS